MDTGFSKRLNSRYFNNKRNGFFVEAGASAGIAHSICKWFEDELGWCGINIEPLPRFFEGLVKNRPKCININCAISNKPGESILVEPFRQNGRIINGWATIDEKTKKRFDYKVQEFKVKVRTYTDIIKEYDIKGVDLFVLDVEGHELKVINDLCNSSVLPKVLAVETDKVDKKDILNLLNPLGYKLDWYDKADSYFVRNING